MNPFELATNHLNSTLFMNLSQSSWRRADHLCMNSTALSHRDWYSMAAMLISAFSIIMNIVVLVLIAIRIVFHTLHEKYMYTVNLLIGDLICSIVCFVWYLRNEVESLNATNMDFTIDVGWYEYEWPRFASFVFEGACPMFHHLLASLSRLVSIRRPLQYYGRNDMRQKVTLTIIAWSLIIWYTVVYTVIVTVVVPCPSQGCFFSELSIFFTYFAIVSVSTVLYISDIVIMRKQSTQFGGSTRSRLQRAPLERALKRLVYLATVYVIIQGPLGVVLFWVSYRQYQYTSTPDVTTACALTFSYAVSLYLILLNICRYWIDPVLCLLLDKELHGQSSLQPSASLQTNMNTMTVTCSAIDLWRNPRQDTKRLLDGKRRTRMRDQLKRFASTEM